MFVSLHGEPTVSYPYYSGFSHEVGASHGEGYNLNYPLPKNTTWEATATPCSMPVKSSSNSRPKCW